MSERTPDDDSVLVERIKSGDREALGVLYDRYSGHALALGLRILRDREAAEDLVHDVFVGVWQKIARFDAERGSIRTWILTIVRNRAIDRLRSASVRLAAPEADAALDIATPPTSTWDAVASNLSAAQLRSAIAKLPDEQRQAIELAYFGGRTYREIATLTGVPHGTANGRLRLALRKLREALTGTDAAPVAFEVDTAAVGRSTFRAEPDGGSL